MRRWVFLAVALALVAVYLVMLVVEANSDGCTRVMGEIVCSEGWHLVGPVAELRAEWFVMIGVME